MIEVAGAAAAMTENEDRNISERRRIVKNVVQKCVNLTINGNFLKIPILPTQ